MERTAFPSPLLILRAESKPGERRSPLTPADAGQLVQAGFRVTVEDSPSRIFPNSEFARAGCGIAPAGSWPRAPLDAFILGLKELREDGSPLSHRHIFFGHAYKNQPGASQLLDRFRDGKGLLLDLESLTLPTGERAAAFGRWAGFVGAALAVRAWYGQRTTSHLGTLGPLAPFENVAALVDWVKRAAEGAPHPTQNPRLLLMGGLGRCGRGAAALAHALGMAPVLWDTPETAAGGPFPEILTFDILVNCVLATRPIPPFLTPDLLRCPRRLRVIADVSCDPSGPVNPLPLYRKPTTLEKPVRRVARDPLLELIAIDHLPTLLPRESSLDFSAQLLPHLLGLGEGSSIWRRAEKVFWRHAAPDRAGSITGSIA